MPVFRRIRPEDYTIGWICALFIELAAAQEMLDDKHEDIYPSGNDTNIYTLGSICGHNVVIACLPEGRTGSSPAAVVAAQMQRTFPSIQVGLLVGVGGGVPTADNDLRLGDVVVGRPDLGHGGVLHCDFGKSIPGGFQRTGALNAPPHTLLNAMSHLRAKHRRCQSTVMEYASKSKLMQQHPGPDILFERDAAHVGGATCEECDETKTIERKPRDSSEIIIHYGTIASGNQVVRDAVERDRLSSELGGVLCFEMEAAGLLNTFPCLVIRGISDYADSHKHKKWQPWASAAAAAYAKDLLSVIPVAAVTNKQQVTNRPGYWGLSLLLKKLTSTDLSLSPKYEDRFHLLPYATEELLGNTKKVPAYFGWSMQELAVGIRIFSRIVKSLEGSKGAAVYFAESTEFLYELQATLQNVQKYQDEVHSRRYCWDIFVFLEAMRSPCEKFIYFVEDYKPALADMQHFGSITLKLSIEEWNVLSRKIIELQDAICQPLKVAHTLLLLQSVEDIVEAVKPKTIHSSTDSENCITKLVNFLEETEITKILKSCIKKLKQAQIQEQDLQSSLDSSNQELQATCQNSEKSVGSHLHPSKWKPMNIGSASKSSEMILAVEVLRKELHRCTGLILDCLLKHTESDSNEQSVSFLLELYERSFRDLHESLNTSWVAVNEFEILLRSTKEPSRMRLLSGWISSWFPPLLGAVIGSAATNLFATLRDETAELEYYRIPFVRNRSASKSGNGDNRDECQHVCQSDFHVHESSRGDKSKSTKLTQNNEEITTFITDVHGTPPHSRRQSPSQARDSSELVKSLKPAYRSDFEEELERSRIRFESRLLESTPSESTAYKPGASDGYSAAFSGSLLGAAVLIGSSGGTGMGLSSGSHDIGGLGMRDEYWMCCQCCMVEGGYRCSQCRHSRCHNCRWWRPPLENPNGRTY